MIPQKPNKLYIELSETLNHSSFLIEEVVEFYYKTVKNLLTDLKHPRVNIEGLGHFVAKTGLVKKSIPKFQNILEKHDTSTYAAYYTKKMIIVDYNRKWSILIVIIDYNRSTHYR